MIQMKKMETFLILFMLCFPCWGCAQRIFDWENPNVVGHNKEDYHSTLSLGIIIGIMSGFILLRC